MKCGVTRRQFLTRLTLAAGSSVVVSHLGKSFAHDSERQSSGDYDQGVFLKTLGIAEKANLVGRPVGDIMVMLGKSFLGTPYVGHTLEAPGEEHLVTNLREFDCLTFVENMLTISRCVKMQVRTFDGFTEQLMRIRYRGGVLDGYPSRLHYFTDWVEDNQQKKIVREVTHDLGGVETSSIINYMSSHRESYRQLSDTTYLARTVANERKLTAAKRYFIPKDHLPDAEKLMRGGDIIGITTSMEGMDIAHTGLAVESGGTIRFLHASLSAKKVELTEGSLAEYLARHGSQTGIIVARPLEPAA
jgi:hypothetical protein